MTVFADGKQRSLSKFYIYLGISFLFVLLVLIQQPFNMVIFKLVGTGSEYTLGEQLTKLFLLITVQVSFLGYMFSQTARRIALSISFLIFGLCIYLSESNMITENTQPFFGLALLLLIAYFSASLKEWKCLCFLALSIVLIASGSAIDQLHELETSNSLIQGMTNFVDRLGIREETFDVLGVIAILLSVLAVFEEAFQSCLGKLGKNNYRWMLGNVSIAAGNSFLHYQYKPDNQLYLLGLGLSITGFLLLFFSTQKIRTLWDRHPGVSSTTVFTFLFAFFVLLPSIYGQSRYIQSILLWAPTFVFIGWHLKTTHPALAQNLPVHRPIK